jgi:hypothetical protein
MSFSRNFRHGDCSTYPSTVRRVRQHPWLHNPTNPSRFSLVDLAQPSINCPGYSIMKIITNVALATCVGLSLGWMSSCSTERTVTETTTRDVAPITPPPAIVTSAPVVPEPVIVAPPNATTESTTTRFDNGTVQKKTVTQYNTAYPPPTVYSAPEVVTTAPQSTTTQTTTTSDDGDVQRQTTTTVVRP